MRKKCNQLEYVSETKSQGLADVLVKEREESRINPNFLA